MKIIAAALNMRLIGKEKWLKHPVTVENRRSIQFLRHFAMLNMDFRCQNVSCHNMPPLGNICKSTVRPLHEADI